MTSSRSTGINYMGLNELINMIYNFMIFSWNILAFNLFFQKIFPFTLILIYNKLIKCTFVNKDETFTFFSLHDPSRIWLIQLAPLWIWWLIETRLQLVILIIVLICSLVVFKLFMACAFLCCTLLTLQVYYLHSVYFMRLLSLALPNV